MHLQGRQYDHRAKKLLVLILPTATVYKSAYSLFNQQFCKFHSMLVRNNHLTVTQELRLRGLPCQSQ